MCVTSDFDVMKILGHDFDYYFLPADHTQGGILVAWRSMVWSASNTSSRSFSVSVKHRLATPGGGGPSGGSLPFFEPTYDVDRPAFLHELHELYQVRDGPLLIIDDFNRIKKSEDKNNGCLNRCLMEQFRQFINDAVVKEIHLSGPLFTWSNERTHPTLE
jgi:hypothetical protein